MKKVLFSIIAIALFTTMNAQYKSVEGDVAIDFGLSGGISNTVVTPHDLGFDKGAAVKLRYFNSDKSAIRGMLLIYNAKETDSDDNVESQSVFTIGAGYEKHFEGTDRLDPFLAGDVLYKREAEKTTTSTTEIEGSNSSFGLRVSIGADYYFAKKVYLGVELGLGMFTGVDGKGSFTSGSSTTDFDGTKVFEIIPSMIGGLKIGYAF